MRSDNTTLTHSTLLTAILLIAGPMALHVFITALLVTFIASITTLSVFIFTEVIVPYS